MRPEPREVAERLGAIDVRPDEAEAKRLYRGVEARRGRSRRAVPIALALAAAVLLAVGVRGIVPAERTALRLEGGALASAVAGRHEAGAFTFDDGSVVSVTGGTELAVVSSRPEGIRFELGSGEAHFDVVPGGGRAWVIRCGVAEVSVLGTAFTLRRDGSRLRVAVERGRVAVESDQREELGAGDVIVVEHAYPEVAIAPVPPAPPAVAPIVPAAPEPVVTPRVARPVAAPTEMPAETPAEAPSTWRALARDGAWADAYASLGEDGVRAVSAGASAEELLLLSDVCRSSRHFADAALVLDRLVSEHAEHPSAALSAYTLGTLEMDRLHQPARAARAFERALSLGLPTGLVADAEARLAQAREAAAE